MIQKTITSLRSRGQLSVNTMLIFITMFSAFTMLANDMYLPAVPSIKDQLNTTVELVNLTLVVFFLMMSISSLIIGPLSDRLGRKPVMLSCIGIYILGSFGCAVSPNIYSLIIFRLFQAIGCGGGMSISAAIVKDFFPADKKEKAFAILGAMIGFVPVIAPVIGAQILRFTSWRGSFVVLTGLGAITFLFALLFKETHLKRSTDPIPFAVLRLFVVLKNPSFARLVLLFSLGPMAGMAFIGISSIVFVNGFGLTEQQFSYFFAANALVSVAGALAYIRLSRIIRPMTLITASIVMSVISGILSLTIGYLHPVLFLVSIAFASFGFSLQRPPSTSLLLEQQDEDSGSAASLISCFAGILGSISLVFISQDWGNRILVLGIMYIVIGLVALSLWLYAKTRCRVPISMQVEVVN